MTEEIDILQFDEQILAFEEQLNALSKTCDEISSQKENFTNQNSDVEKSNINMTVPLSPKIEETNDDSSCGELDIEDD